MSPTDDKTIDVLCFGEAIVDFFPDVPGLPLIDVDVYRRHLGGAPTNVAIALARQGVRTALMTLVGPDDFGRFVKTRLAAEGVDISAVGTHPTEKTAITFVSVAANGDRSFMFFRHPSADQAIAPADVSAEHIERARIFHFGSSTMSREPGRAATLAAVEVALDSGAIISMDPNFRRHLWLDPEAAAPLIRSLVARCDVLKVSDDELTALTGIADADTEPEAGAAALRALGAKLVIVTRGAKGSYYDARAGCGHVPGETVAVVDTTGAGDAFVAGVLATLAPHFTDGRTVTDLDEKTIRAACARGNHLGGCAVTALGATTAVPGLRG